MPLTQKAQALLRAWEKRFRHDFTRDGGACFGRLLERFGLTVDAQAMLEGTVEFVTVCVVFSDMNGLDVREFLADQCYDGTSDATYAVVFDVCNRGAARLLVALDLRSVDLEDLYAFPWQRLETVGFSRLWIFRLDGHAMAPLELDAIEQNVTDDITFDDVDEEVSIDFDPDTYDKALAVNVCDLPFDPSAHLPSEE